MRKLSSFGYNDCRCFNFFNYCCNDIVVQYSRDYAVLIIVFFLFSCKNFLAGLKYEGFQENKNISGHQQDFLKQFGAISQQFKIFWNIEEYFFQ